MNGQDFLKLTTSAFLPFLKEMGFEMSKPDISGRLYSIDFKSSNHRVSVSYEPGDEVMFIIIFSVENGSSSNIDDRSKTPRLSDLNNLYMKNITLAQRAENDDYFKSITALDSAEHQLLKSAKELRLVLPQYIQSASEKNVHCT
jgi:hypothetical protein